MNEHTPMHARTLPRMLRDAAERFGDRPLLRIGETQWRHADAPSAAAARAASFHDAGVRAGDRVASMCGNRIELLETFLGCGWIGAVSVPINTAAMGPQIGYYLANSGAKLLVIEDRYVERLMMTDLASTAVEAIWVIGGAKVDAPASVANANRGATVDAAANRGVTAAAATPTPTPTPTPEIIAGVPCQPWPRAGTPIDPAPVGPGDPLAILYTSGTTGPAKGVICPHAQYRDWGTNTATILANGADDVLCTTLPLFHINALNTFAQALASGACAIYEPRFSASTFWATMQANGATVIYLLGAMVPILLAQPGNDAERSHCVRIGLGPGVPASASTAFRMRTDVRLVEGYGSTESNFVIATTAPGAPSEPRDGVMGWLVPGFDARVVDENDEPLPDGEPGELLLRADAPFAFASGYFSMPQATVDAWRNLWLHTGDRVVREADGAFRFIDRIKDAIRRRGENISSFEVEQVLAGYPAIAAVAVFPVRSELAEDEVMATLVAREGQSIDPAEIARWCETRLPYFAIPRYIDVVDDLPRTENGKVQKFRLRERGAGPGTWDRGARTR